MPAPIASASDTDFHVALGGEVYTMLEIPAKTSAIVLARKAALEEQLHFEALIRGLARSRMLLWCAYNGTAGAGKLRTDVFVVHNRLTQLYGASVSSMNVFASESVKILDDLWTACQAVFRGDEPFAIQFLTLCKTLAARLSQQASDLAGQFDAAASLATETLAKTKAAQGVSEARRNQLAAAMDNLKAEMERDRQLSEDLEKHRRALAREYEVALAGQARAERQDAAKRCVNVVTTPLRLLTATPPLGYRAASYREAAAEVYTLLLQKEQEQRANLQRMAQHAGELATAQNLARTADTYAHSLYLAAGALARVSTALRDAAMFWACMAAACDSASLASTAEHVRWYQNLEPEVRFAIYRDTGFKGTIVTAYASWRAIELIASDYSAVMQEAFDGLQQDLRANPTVDQSRQLLPLLGKQLGLETQHDIEANEARQMTLRRAATE